MPDARQNSSKLAEMFARASSFNALVGMAVDVVSLFMALLSFVGIITPSLAAQGEQRRSSYFNIDWDIPGQPVGRVDHCPAEYVCPVCAFTVDSLDPMKKAR